MRARRRVSACVYVRGSTRRHREEEFIHVTYRFSRGKLRSYNFFQGLLHSRAVREKCSHQCLRVSHDVAGYFPDSPLHM